MLRSGNLILRNVKLSSPELGPLTCPDATDSATVDPAASWTCTGTKVVNATDLEQGELVFRASGTSATLPTVVAAAESAQLTMQAEPQLTMRLVPGSCQQSTPTGRRPQTAATLVGHDCVAQCSFVVSCVAADGCQQPAVAD